MSPAERLWLLGGVYFVDGAAADPGDELSNNPGPPLTGLVAFVQPAGSIRRKGYDSVYESVHGLDRSCRPGDVPLGHPHSCRRRHQTGRPVLFGIILQLVVITHYALSTAYRSSQQYDDSPEPCQVRS